MSSFSREVKLAPGAAKVWKQVLRSVAAFGRKPQKFHALGGLSVIAAARCHRASSQAKPLEAEIKI
jgi:hypothetical protein